LFTVFVDIVQGIYFFGHLPKILDAVVLRVSINVINEKFWVGPPTETDEPNHMTYLEPKPKERHLQATIGGLCPSFCSWLYR